ncbi:MAG: hypothetical protein AB1555_13410 [Nitrospirota bacterium]
MATAQTETYQLAGLDARERGFNRSVDFERAGDGYRAVFRYETERILTDEKDTREAALIELVRVLQVRGYRQLRSRVSVRNGVYLGSQEPWVEYPDPTRQPEEHGLFNVFRWLRRWFNT